MTDGAIGLEIHDLRFAYPGRPLWSGWGVRFRPGVSLIQGDDGVGKTTLLRVLAGALSGQGGHISLHLPHANAPLLAPSAAYRQHVAWTDPRQPDLPAQDGLTPESWLAAWPARRPAWSAKALQAHIDGWALAAHLGKPFHALSTGTQRKVFMAAALASGAAVTLIDEPTAGLDKPSITYLQSALDELAEQSERVVLVAHYEPLMGVRWRDVVVLPG